MGRLDTAREGATRLDAGFVRRWVDEIAAAMEAQKDYLTQLDAAIGDADHGVNMHRGFSAVVAKVAAAQDLPPGKFLTTVGMTLISTVGGASGPLYGTAFREAGKALGNGETFELPDLVVALRAGLDGIRKLGAAAEGDKTIVDAYSPALAAMEGSATAGATVSNAATRAREAAEKGMRATIPLQARKGRASYLGPRSMGHQDPGATSTAFIFAALERTASGP